LDIIIIIFLSVLVFGGVILFLVFMLSRLLAPRKINVLRTLMKNQNYRQAVKVAKDILSRDNANIEAHYYLAECYQVEGKDELALIEYKAADKIGIYNRYVSEIELRQKLAELYDKFENYDESLKEYILLSNKYPDDYTFHHKIGELFEKKDSREQAVSYYQRALKLNPGFTQSMLNLGMIYYETRKLADAAELLENALKKNSSNYKAHLYLGLIRKEENNPAGALKHLETASRDKKLKVRALMERGKVHMASGKYENAVIELERALKNCPEEKLNIQLNIRYVLASCYEHLRNLTEAITQWEVIYSKQQNFKNVAEKLASYQELRMDDKMKDFMTATREEFHDICKRIITQNMGLNISTMKEVPNEGIEFLTLEPDSKWRNVKKRPKLIYIYRSNSPIDEATVRRVYESMRLNNVIKCVVICASSYSALALSFVQERPIELVDKNGLQDILNNVGYNPGN
jgi:tetratricopeptide (TPR) repeat protein